MRALSTLVVIYAVASPVARAQEDVDAAEAKKHYTRGMAHYNLDEFDRAVEEFQAGYRLKPDPVFLYNVAQCYRRAKRPEQALAFYEKYLHASDDNPPNKAEVQTRIRDLKKLIKDAGAVESTQPSSPLPPRGVRSEEPPRRAPPPTVEEPPAPEPVKKETPAPEVTPPAKANLELPGTVDNQVAKGPLAPERPIYKRWYFWTGIAAVVVIAAVVTIAVLASGSSSSERGLPDLMAQ